MKKLIKKGALLLVVALALTEILPQTAGISSAATVVTPKLNATKKTIYVGKGYTFKVKNKIKKSTFTWASSDKKVIAINKETGLSAGKAPGKAIISCTMTIGTTKKVLEATVTVKQSATDISIKNAPENRTMLLGDSIDLNRKLTPKTSTDKTYWVITSTNNTAEATVDSKGVVTPKKEGSFTIKAVAANTKAKYEKGNISAQTSPITITVKSPVPELTSIKTTDSKTIILEFNQEIEEATIANFGVYTSNNVACSINKVETDKNKAIITLNNSLISNSTYKVSAFKIKGKGKTAVLESITKDIVYTKSIPATIELVSNTIAIGDSVEYIIKDSNGNDITKDYPVVDLIVGTSGQNIVSTNLKALATGTEVISITIPNSNVRIANQTVYVVVSRAIPSSFAEITLGDQGTNILTLYRNDVNKFFNCAVRDKDGKIIATFVNKVASGDSSFEFVSTNPTVLGVDLTTGIVVPISKGTASVKITATVNNVTITDTVPITVREEPYVNNIKVSSTNIKLVKGSDITTGFDVELLDQYGATYTQSTSLTYSANNSTRIDVSNDSSVLGNTINVVNGKARILINEKDNGTIGDTVITVSAGGKNANVVVSLVQAGTFSRYVTVVSDKTLDINSSKEGLPVNVTPGERTASVTVYMLDTNGNYMGYASNVVLKATNTTNSPVSVVNYNGNSGAIVAESVGTEAVTVSVGTAVIETIIITVVDSKPVIKDVILNNEKITVNKGENISFQSNISTVFTAKDQYGQNINITLYEVVSLDSRIVSAGGMSVYALETGTADVVVTIKSADGIKVADKVVKVVVVN